MFGFRGTEGKNNIVEAGKKQSLEGKANCEMQFWWAQRRLHGIAREINEPQTDGIPCKASQFEKHDKHRRRHFDLGFMKRLV